MVLSQTHVIDGKELDCKRAVPRDQRSESSKDETSFRTKKLFVGGLTQTTTEESFKEYFEQFGKIEDWVIMVDKATGKSRGFGFITFESEDSVEMAVARYLENKIDGKWVECKKALPRDANSAAISQSSTTTVSPSVSANSSKKNSLNKHSGAGGESDQDIVRSILSGYQNQGQGARLSVDSELENNLPAPHFQNVQPNINHFADKPSFWESLLGPETTSRTRGDNTQGGEPERFTRHSTVYYQYQPPFLQQPNFQQQQPNYQQQSVYQQQQLPQKSQSFNGPYSYMGNTQPKFVPTQDIKSQGIDVISPTNFKMPPIYKQEPLPLRPEQDSMNFPPGLNLYDTSSQGYSFDPAWVETKNTPMMNQFQMDSGMNFKSSYPTQQQQASIPQKKVEKYIPLYEANDNISSTL
eukprot:CAMPEP_0176424420 /NCGR_PEP_ID=MMETSP0127-20121128/10828_1 /TAXON_ID=938130 /ORGANISM="Platyophrya macrostoma, Strain WH" /LENGTH=409 /DNA_ID=CAMNT_0017805477 /DNA_START=247 /DNA_END=1476 /DNA_ORIENTATION=-